MERQLMHRDDPAHGLAQREGHARLPHQHAHVDRAAARMAGLADAAAGLVDHRGVRLGDVVQQAGHEQHEAAVGIGAPVVLVLRQCIEHHARVDADVALGVVVRILRRLLEAQQARQQFAAACPVGACAGRGHQRAKFVESHRGLPVVVSSAGSRSVRSPRSCQPSGGTGACRSAPGASRLGSSGRRLWCEPESRMVWTKSGRTHL